MRETPPRRRPPSSGSWTRPLVERLTPAVKVLVIAQAVTFAFFVMVREVRGFVLEHLALGPRFFAGELWQPVTALLLQFEVLGFLFNLIGLWFVGAFIERTHGTRRFLQLFLVAGIGANLAIAGVHRLQTFAASDIIAGPSYAILAFFVAFGRLYGRAPAQILPGLVMQARHIAWLLVGWSMIADLIRRDWAGMTGGVVAVAAGYFLAGTGFGDIVALWRARRVRRRYRVIEGGAERPKKGSRYLN